MKQKIYISTHLSTSLKAVYESFIISQTSRGISNATITNFRNHLRGIAKYIDIDMPFDELSKRHLEEMVVSMRKAGLDSFVKADFSIRVLVMLKAKIRVSKTVSRLGYSRFDLSYSQE